MNAYHGCYLWIDLSTGRQARRPLAERTLRGYLGGAGLGTYLLHREAPPAVDPLAAEAPLIFALSPLVGTPMTTSAKFAVVAKSPLTDRLNDALSSSHFALAAKRAGMDALVIAGVLDRPGILVINDDRVEIRPAGDLWGLEIPQAEARLRQELGPRFQTAVIGPAGENRVRYATISHASRHAGRGGLGAVMGSKRLKAVAVAGSRRVPVADPAAVIELARRLSARSFGPATAKYRELGTLANLLAFNRLAALPVRNFQDNTFAAAEKLSVESLAEAARVARKSCAACTIGCEHIYRAGDVPVRLEYETLFALGPLCGVEDRDAILQAARRCDDLGLDTISTGGTLAFAMECGARGLLEAGKLRFGDGPALLDQIEAIACRRGLGDQLAEGSRRLAAELGGGADEFAPHVKGLELPGYEPRALQTMALGFAVGSRGADHNRSGAYEADFSRAADRLRGGPAAARLAVETEDRAALMDSLILCKFLRGVFHDLFAESAELLTPITGWDVSGEELHRTARRIVTAKKLYNIREGWTASEDTLPRRFLAEKLPDGVSAGAVLPRERLETMIQAYYAERGWDAAGRVPAELVVGLGLTDLMGFWSS